MNTRRRICRVSLAVAMGIAVALPASAARVTSFTVSPTHIVGGTGQRATASFTVAFDPGEKIKAPYEWFSYRIYSVVVHVDETSHWGTGYFHCANYVPIGSTSVTCQIPAHWAVPTSKTVTLLARAQNINYGNSSPFNNDPGLTVAFTVDPAPPDLRVRAGVGTGPNAPGTQTKAVSGSSPVSVTVPLGAAFFIQLTKADLTGVTSDFALTQPAIAPPLTEASLFPGAVAIEFDEGRPADTKYFQAVHLGTGLLTITPSSGSLPPVKVAITVNRPVSLNGSPHEYDTRLIELGHQRGIPPQFLKGQISRESGFDPQAYRYEPLSQDLAVFSPAGRNLRAQSPYSLYRLAAADGLSQGASLLDDDVAPRSQYQIVVDGTARPIGPADVFVSARAIYDANVMRERWDKASPRRAARVKKQPGLLDFTAQTAVAASYGLLQILYPTAVAPMGWSGIAGEKNPSSLFDSDANAAAGGGSLALGSDYLRRVFRRANPTLSASSPAFARPDDFVAAFRRAFNFYNHSTPDGDYGSEVLARAATFLPPVTSLFQ